MNYNDLSEEVKNKMFDIRLEEVSISPYQEQFRYIIGRDFWIEHNKDILEHYYKKVNKLVRKEKINKIISKI